MENQKHKKPVRRSYVEDETTPDDEHVEQGEATALALHVLQHLDQFELDGDRQLRLDEQAVHRAGYAPDLIGRLRSQKLIVSSKMVNQG